MQMGTHHLKQCERPIQPGLLYYYMKLHNAWLLKTSSKKKKKKTQQQPVTMGLGNTAKAVDHVKIESI